MSKRIPKKLTDAEALSQLISEHLLLTKASLLLAKPSLELAKAKLELAKAHQQKVNALYNKVKRADTLAHAVAPEVKVNLHAFVDRHLN